MKVTNIKEEGLSRIYQIIIPYSKVDKAIEARLKEVALNAKIDGFRKGKVPVSIIKSRYETQVRGEVVEKQVSESIKNFYHKSKYLQT